MILYIPKIGDCLNILTDEELKDFSAINFSKCFKPTRENLYSKLNEEQNLSKVAKSPYIFLRTPDEVRKYAKMMPSNSTDNSVHRYIIMILNLFHRKLQLINTKPMTKNKLKELLSEFKKVKVKALLVLEYKKRNYRKISLLKY